MQNGKDPKVDKPPVDTELLCDIGGLEHAVLEYGRNETEHKRFWYSNLSGRTYPFEYVQQWKLIE